MTVNKIKIGPALAKDQDQGSAMKLIAPINDTQPEYIKDFTISSKVDKKSLSRSERLDSGKSKLIDNLSEEVIKDLVSTLSEKQNRQTWIFDCVDANTCSYSGIKDSDNVNFDAVWTFVVDLPEEIAKRIFDTEDLNEIAAPLISNFIDNFRDLSLLNNGGGL